MMSGVAKTITNAAGDKRLLILQRRDGLFQYWTERLIRDEELDPPFYWSTNYPASGLFAAPTLAEQDARTEFDWLEGASEAVGYYDDGRFPCVREASLLELIKQSQTP